MQPVKGKTHYFGDHPPGLQVSSPYKQWVINFEKIAQDLGDMQIEVVNCSMNSALRCFKKIPLQEALN